MPGIDADRLLLIMTVFVWFMEDCQNQSNGLVGPKDYKIPDWQPDWPRSPPLFKLQVAYTR